MMGHLRIDPVPLLEDHDQALAFISPCHWNNCSILAYRDTCPFEERLIRDQRHIVVDANHEPTLERTILILRIFLASRLHLEHPKSLDLQKLDAHRNIID